MNFKLIGNTESLIKTIEYKSLCCVCVVKEENGKKNTYKCKRNNFLLDIIRYLHIDRNIYRNSTIHGNGIKIPPLCPVLVGSVE